MSKFAKDTRVMRDFTDVLRAWNLQRGITITEPVNDALTGKEKVYVKWDQESYKRPNPEEVFTEHLLTEEEGDAKFNILVAEYNKLEEAITAKIEEAAKLIDEASDLAESKGHNLQEMHDAIRPLISSMDGAGWNTSSWGC